MIGFLNGVALFFFPGVRRLAIYKRLPIAGIVAFWWFNWGYHYGRDLVYHKTRLAVENWERDMGLRNFQLGL
jgi:hypothetical protein